ncbi:MAG: hypothetical protein M1812_004458 [Candelaria pacifica]|nr:MAG: hypothetical protein M1812_004458 [Candelaria pacifica]
MIASFGIPAAQIGKWAGITTAIFSLAQCLTAIIWGRASDRFGRKPVILWGLSCTMVTSICFGFSQTLAWAIVARTLAGLGNGNVGIIRTMVAEIVPQKDLQPRAFSIMPLIWTIGSTLGPAFGGALSNPAQRYPKLFGGIHLFEAFPFALPNLLAGVFFLIGLVTGVLFLNESLETRKSQRDYGRVLGNSLVDFFRGKPKKTTIPDHVNQARPLLETSRTPISPATPERNPLSNAAAQKDPQRPPGASSSSGYREVFVFQSNVNLLVYTLLALHSVAYDQTLPVFMHHPRQDHNDTSAVQFPFKFAGGFGLESSRIGVLFMIYGFFGMFVQFLVYPPVARRFGILNCLKTSAITFPIVYLLTPFTVLLSTSTARQTVLVANMLVKSVAVIFAFPSSTILITNSAASLLVLGTLNGVATSVGAIGRAAGSAIGGSTFSAGVKAGYVILPWWTISFFAVTGAIPVWWLAEMEGFGEAGLEEVEDDETDGEDRHNDDVAVGEGPSPAKVTPCNSSHLGGQQRSLSSPVGLSVEAVSSPRQMSNGLAQTNKGYGTAGKNLSQAIWTRERWQEFGIANTNIVAYEVYVNYPLGHRLALLENSKRSHSNSRLPSLDEGSFVAEKESWKIKFEASLEEDVLEEDGTSRLKDRIPTFHGYSASGNVTAPYVYVNYGTYRDYEDLRERNVSLGGKIALVKYGRIFRGLKVKRAQELGMVGVIMYSDPGDDGDVTEENGFQAYPNGPAREPSSVQRGSTQFLSISPGDPTTPGYPSKPGVPRQNPNGSIPSVPSLPISYVDALPLLKALNGHGPQASSMNRWWQGGGLGSMGVGYHIGPSPDNLLLNLVNQQEYVTTPMWNVIGIINGTLADEVIVLGNHRDAWIAGGAGDPNSGSAALNEVIRSFGAALDKGWKPTRTIVFCSWDGEEYGLIGSTEWVEEYLPWLANSAVAYLNVDVGTTGPKFRTAASPLLNRALYEATSLVQSPNQTITGQTIRDLWDGHISTMGSGSDFTAFQDFAGVPSVDMGFVGEEKSPVYHYHSNYDSFSWMNRFGDPDFHYHIAITKVWALLAANLVEAPIIDFNVTDYAEALEVYLTSVKEKVNDTIGGGADQWELNAMHPISFHDLDNAIQRLHDASTNFDLYASLLVDRLHKDVPWWQWWKKVQLFFQVRSVNDKFKYFERQFLHQPGLDGRTFFKHVIFAPGLWTGYAGATMPGLVEAIDARNWTNAEVSISLVLYGSSTWWQGTVHANGCMPNAEVGWYH